MRRVAQWKNTQLWILQPIIIKSVILVFGRILACHVVVFILIYKPIVFVAILCNFSGILPGIVWKFRATEVNYDL